MMNLENRPPEAIAPRGPEGNLEDRGVRIAEGGGRIFQFIPTRGSALTFFFPEREVLEIKPQMAGYW